MQKVKKERFILAYIVSGFSSKGEEPIAFKVW